MKKVALILCTYLPFTMIAQSTVNISNKIEIKLSGKSKVDSIIKFEVTDENNFTIRVDESTLNGDSCLLESSTLVYDKSNYTSINITDWTKEYKLKDKEKIVILFKINENNTKPKPKSFIHQLVISKEEKKEPTADEKMLDTVLKTFKALMIQESTKSDVGEFELIAKPNSIVIQGYPKTRKDTLVNKDTISIDTISITLRNGSIARRGLYIKAHSNKTQETYTFRNMGEPIDLSNIDAKWDMKLYKDNINKLDEWILLGNVLKYTFIGEFTFPSNSTYNLTGSKKTVKVQNKTTLSDIINASFFSDMLALIGRRPNGLIQTDININFIINSINRYKKDLFFLHTLSIYGALSKFDSKFQSIDSSNIKPNLTSRKDTIDRLYVNRVAFFRVGAKLNLLKRNLWPNESILINAGAEMAYTNADSIYKGKDIVSFLFYPEIEYHVNFKANFGVELAVKSLFQIIPDKTIYENNRPITILNPSLCVYYYPFSNPNNRIYFKATYFAKMKSNNINTNYPQVQFGYKTNLFKKEN